MAVVSHRDGRRPTIFDQFSQKITRKWPLRNVKGNSGSNPSHLHQISLPCNLNLGFGHLDNQHLNKDSINKASVGLGK